MLEYKSARGKISKLVSRQYSNCLTLVVSFGEYSKTTEKWGLTPDGDTFQLFHTSQITIIMDPAD